MYLKSTTPLLSTKAQKLKLTLAGKPVRSVGVQKERDAEIQRHRFQILKHHHSKSGGRNESTRFNPGYNTCFLSAKNLEFCLFLNLKFLQTSSNFQPALSCTKSDHQGVGQFKAPYKTSEIYST